MDNSKNQPTIFVVGRHESPLRNFTGQAADGGISPSSCRHGTNTVGWQNQPQCAGTFHPHLAKRQGMSET